MNYRGPGAPALPRIQPFAFSAEKRKAVFDEKARRFVTWLNVKYESQMAADVRDWMDDLRHELYEHYRVWANPLYRPLIDSIVEIDGMCRELFGQSKVFHDEALSAVHDRYHRWRLLQLHFIRQLQRHTEALTFSVRQYKDEADVLLQLVWKVLTQHLPEDSQEIVMDALVEAVQGSMTAAPVLGALSHGSGAESAPQELRRSWALGPRVLAPWEREVIEEMLPLPGKQERGEDQQG